MPESIPATGTVHWVGAGLSTGSGLRVVCDRADHVVLWARTARKAEDRLTQLGLAGHAAAEAFEPDKLTAAVKPGDVVVSMLPAAQHVALLRSCISQGAHFACSSYVSEPMLGLVPQAELAGIAVLAEAGLDPGIDHLLAHKLVADGHAVIGSAPAAAEFTSYCGGLPAVPNDFRYRFSWAPRGVLSALCQPARYIEDGEKKVARHPWEAVRSLTVGSDQFEVYPNRDSIPFAAQYGIPASWRLEVFVRGTLRLNGWSAAWAGVFAELRAADQDRITALATELAARYQVTDADLDRVVLVVALRLRPDCGPDWSGEYRIDLTGDQAESAMARCVSVPLACGVTEILAGRMTPGLHRAAQDADEAGHWLDFLAEQGIQARQAPRARPGQNLGSR